LEDGDGCRAGEAPIRLFSGGLASFLNPPLPCGAARDGWHGCGGRAGRPATCL